ncbi:hypothetical protein V6N13_142733 [Hibiscus sabdariffa]|uniref:Uncharacterized protein n=1 Tax=Hibiscus sabdariffa TaxID=183260 RepID=A0ABR2FF19_9ROSI
MLSQAGSRPLLREIGNNNNGGGDNNVYSYEWRATNLDGTPNEIPATYTYVWKLNEENDGRTADRSFNWMNQQTGSSYGLDDEKEQISPDISDPEQAIKEIGLNVCALLREQLAIENKKAIAGERNLLDLEAEIMERLVEELGITVGEDSAQTITTFEDAAYLIQKLCSEESVVSGKIYTRT